MEQIYVAKADSHFIDDLPLVHSASDISLVGKNQDRNTIQLWLVQQVMKLISRRLNFLMISCIHHIPSTIQSIKPDAQQLHDIVAKW